MTSAVPAQRTTSAGWTSSNIAVPDLAGLVVAGVAGGEHGAADRLAQLGDLAAGQRVHRVMGMTRRFGVVCVGEATDRPSLHSLSGALCREIALGRRRPRCPASSSRAASSAALRAAPRRRGARARRAARCCAQPSKRRRSCDAPQRAAAHPAGARRSRGRRGAPRRGPSWSARPAMAGRSSTASARASASPSSSRAARDVAAAHLEQPQRHRAHEDRALLAELAAQLERGAQMRAAASEVALRARQAAHVVERQRLAAAVARWRGSARGPRRGPPSPARRRPSARAVQARLLSA